MIFISLVGREIESPVVHSAGQAFFEEEWVLSNDRELFRENAFAGFQLVEIVARAEFRNIDSHGIVSCTEVVERHDHFTKGIHDTDGRVPVSIQVIVNVDSL